MTTKLNKSSTIELDYKEVKTIFYTLKNLIHTVGYDVVDDDSKKAEILLVNKLIEYDDMHSCRVCNAITPPDCYCYEWQGTRELS